MAIPIAERTMFRDIVDLSLPCRLKDKDKPLSEYLWKSTQSQQQDALNSKFIQGLRYGNLDPTDFGGYMVQDSIYCYNIKRCIDKAAENATNPNLQKFLKERSESYKKYYKELFKLWHIRDVSGIELNEACNDYVALEKKVADTMDPLYLVVALIPCARLWSWLGQQISDAPNFSVYKSWVEDNLNPNSKGYTKLEQIIDNAFLAQEIDEQKALSIYKECMSAEAKFFNSV